MLEYVALWAEVLGGAAVIGGVIFGLAQLRLYHRERQDRAAIEVVRSMLSQHFPSSYRLMTHLPDGVTLAQVRAKGPQYEEAVFAMATVFETLGFMVYRGVVSLDVARNLIGGVCVSMWRKLETYLREVSRTEGQERVVEWWEWLVDRLEEHDRGLPRGRASERFRDWKP